MDQLRRLWAVWEDGTVDGLRWRLIRDVRRRFPYASTTTTFADDVVAVAFDSAVAVLSKGGRIRSFDAWFYKTIRLVASKRIDEARVLHERGRDVASALHPTSSDASAIAERETRRAELVEHALDHATALLPRIGKGQVRQVMNLFLEAVREGVPDYPPTAIADVLGISESQARVLLHRGLSRLRREAECEGIMFPDVFEPEAHEPYGSALDGHDESQESEL